MEIFKQMSLGSNNPFDVINDDDLLTTGDLNLLDNQDQGA